MNDSGYHLGLLGIKNVAWFRHGVVRSRSRPGSDPEMMRCQRPRINRTGNYRLATGMMKGGVRIRLTQEVSSSSTDPSDMNAAMMLLTQMNGLE